MRVIFQRSIFVLLSLAGSLLYAQEVASTPPVGGMRLALPGAKSSLLSIPVLKAVSAVGRALKVSEHAVTLSHVSWTVGQYRPTATASYYMEFTTGALAGVMAKIVDNTATSLELEPSNYSLLAHPLGRVVTDSYDATFQQTLFGDLAVIRPFWTIGEVLGTTAAELQLTAFPSSDAALSLHAGDRIYLPKSGEGSWDQLAAAPLFYVQGLGWRQTGHATTDRQGEVLRPGQPWLAVRQSLPSSVLVIVGNIQLTRAATYIPAGTAKGRDILIASRLSEPVKLSNSGLSSDDPAKRVLTPSPSLGERVDEYYSFGSQLSTPFLEPSHRYLWVTGQGWQEPGNAQSDIAQTVDLQPGTGGLLRLRPSSPGGFWLQVPQYK